MTATAIVRERYQLTIPESIRDNLSWLRPGTAMHLSSVDNYLIIRPYQENSIDWQETWKVFKLAASKGKKISLAKFSINDRLTRR